MGYYEDQYPDLYPPEQQYASTPDYSLYQSVQPTPVEDYPSPYPSVAAPSAAPNLFPTQSAPNPYDTSGLLDSLIKASSSRIDGINAEKDRVRNEVSSLDGSAQNDWRQLGASLVGGIAGLLGGGTGAAAAQGAAATGTSYYNNLEAHEKERKVRLATQLASLETEGNSAQNFNQSLLTGSLSAKVAQDQAYQKGEYPGTPPAAQAAADKMQIFQSQTNFRNQSAIDKKQKLFDLGLSSNTDLDAPLSDKQKIAVASVLSGDPADYTTYRSAQLAAKLQGIDLSQDKMDFAKQKRQDNITSSNDLGDLVEPKNPDVPMKTDDRKEIKASASAIPELIRNVDDLKNSIAQYGNINLGTIGADQQRLIANYILNIRKFYNEGTKLTAGMQQIDQQTLGASVLGENTPQAFLQTVTGTELTKLLDGNASNLMSTFNDRVNAYGGRLTLDKYSANFPKTGSLLMNYLNKAGLDGSGSETAAPVGPKKAGDALSVNGKTFKIIQAL